MWPLSILILMHNFSVWNNPLFLQDRVLLGKINCDTDSKLRAYSKLSRAWSLSFFVVTTEDLCSNPFHVTKYPTLKILRYGMVRPHPPGLASITWVWPWQVARREYRGQRTAEAIVNFVREQSRDPVQTIKDMSELNSQVIMELC